MKNTKRTLATTHAHVKTHTSHSYSCASNKRTPKHKLIYTHAHSYTANTFTQVMMVGPAQHAVLASTSLLTAVLPAAHVPSTPTRLLLARIKATANATQATQVKMNIRDKHDTSTHNHTCTTPKYKYAHISTLHTSRNEHGTHTFTQVMMAGPA